MNENLFTQWFEKKYLEWRGIQQDRKANLTRFAKWLRIKQSSLSHYLNGNAIPEGENLFRIATKLGFEVYTILGYDEPDRAVREWQLLYELTPDDMKDELIQMNKDWLKKKGVSNG